MEKLGFLQFKFLKKILTLNISTYIVCFKICVSFFINLRKTSVHKDTTVLIYESWNNE